jgi:hypothetical protein
VEETKGATIAAHEELEVARNHQKSANKKKCLIVILVVAILSVIIVPLLIKYIPRGNRSVHMNASIIATPQHARFASKALLQRKQVLRRL